MKKADKRCPWCGKQIKMGNSFSERLKYCIAPVRQCKECLNPMSSTASVLVYLPILMAFVMLYLNVSVTEFVITMIVLALLFVGGIVMLGCGAVTYKKMGADGKNIVESKQKYCAVVISELPLRIAKGGILLTSADFDGSKAFESSSPIKVLKYSEKSRKIEFQFLYSNEKTSELLQAKQLTAFSGNNAENSVSFSILLK